MVEEIREQLDKAPDEYRQRFSEVLETYKRTCAEEREKVIEAGGLHILGTERHESRRIDNQLRGRAGRQGDPGSSRFYLSLEDDLMRIFGADRIQGIMSRLGMEDGEPIEHGLVTRAIENAQKKVEAHNFDIRKHLLEYDDVLNKQREVIYSQRREVLKGETLKEDVLEMAHGIAEETVARYTDKDAILPTGTGQVSMRGSIIISTCLSRSTRMSRKVWLWIGYSNWPQSGSAGLTKIRRRGLARPCSGSSKR